MESPIRLAPERAPPYMRWQPDANPSQLDERRPVHLNRRLSTTAVPVCSLANLGPGTVPELRLEPLSVHTLVIQLVGLVPRRLVKGQAYSVFDNGAKCRSLFGG